jgi:dolichol-phosphate mannosyltransferase
MSVVSPPVAVPSSLARDRGPEIGEVRSGPALSVIVPTYNEADNIDELLDRLTAALRDVDHEVIVVDDDSPDRTWEIARARADADPRFRVVRRLSERGLSSAVLAGMAVADGRAIGVIDADLQHDEAALAEMAAIVLGREADICVGTRSGEEGSYGDWSARRRLASWVAATLARVLLPVRTSDPMSGYFVISRETYEKVGSDINPRGFKILLEFLARGQDLRVTEVGYRFRNRTRGITKLSGAIVRNYLIAILDLRFGKRVSPVFLMYCVVGATGVVVNLAGFGFGELVGMPRVSLGLAPELDPIYLSVVFGIQLSIVTNYLGNNYLTFHEDRFRGWRLLEGFARFEVVSIVGLVVQTSVFQLLQQNELPTAAMHDGVRALVNNGAAIGLATFTNFFLNSTITWNRRGRGHRFTYG